MIKMSDGLRRQVEEIVKRPRYSELVPLVGKVKEGKTTALVEIAAQLKVRTLLVSTDMHGRALRNRIRAREVPGDTYFAIGCEETDIEGAVHGLDPKLVLVDGPAVHMLASVFHRRYPEALVVYTMQLPRNAPEA